MTHRLGMKQKVHFSLVSSSWTHGKREAPPRRKPALPCSTWVPIRRTAAQCHRRGEGGRFAGGQHVGGWQSLKGGRRRWQGRPLAACQVALSSAVNLQSWWRISHLSCFYCRCAQMHKSTIFTKFRNTDTRTRENEKKLHTSRFRSSSRRSKANYTSELYDAAGVADSFLPKYSSP